MNKPGSNPGKTPIPDKKRSYSNTEIDIVDPDNTTSDTNVFDPEEWDG